MKQGIFEIAENAPAAPGVSRLALRGDTSAVTAPGQFVNIRLDGFFLRRPLSVCDWDASGFSAFYKVVGGGTEALSQKAAGGTLDVLTGLGNGFDLAAAGDRPLLIGGGSGVSPLYGLARRLAALGKRPAAALGFNTAAEVYLAAEFAALGIPVHLATLDGGAGTAGTVVDAIRGLDYSYFYACGPEAMLRAVDKAAAAPGEFSFEARMGCGFGACMGCTCKTKYGAKRICRDGPVLKREEVLW